MPTAPRRTSALRHTAVSFPAPRPQTRTQVTLVTGPPCGGKSTYVQDQRAPGDLVLDLDALLEALSGQAGHDQPEALRPLALDARDAVLQRLWTGRHAVRRAWIILCAPTSIDRAPFVAKGCRVVLCTASPDTLLRRAKRERPERWVRLVAQWLDVADQYGVDEVVNSG